MSIYKPQGSPFYHYDFQFKGDRFYGSTGCTSKREAEAFERAERDRLVDEIVAESFGLGPLEVLLKDPSISDIMVNGFDNVYVTGRKRVP